MEGQIGPRRGDHIMRCGFQSLHVNRSSPEAGGLVLKQASLEVVGVFVGCKGFSISGAASRVGSFAETRQVALIELDWSRPPPDLISDSSSGKSCLSVL